jgi:UDP-N-acetylglucosamine--N-acetylmuramyl-(pentapeptide) pyrophosphoryl-undecaprenol N-acetylglucosamine transferase
MKRRPIVLMEQNAMPGMTNRLLSRLAKRVAVGLPGGAKYFPAEKVAETGLPLREEVSKSEVRPESFWEGPLRVLVFGGSQGAHAINSAVAGALHHLGEAARNIQFVHQTGEADLERTRKAYAETGVKGEAAPFFYDMGERYRWAHVAVARAGAMTVAELSAMGVPALLVPLPASAHGHQEANARFLAERGAARMILESDFTGESLAGFLKEMAGDREKLAEMSRRALGLAGGDASGQVAGICRELARAA